MSWKKVRRFVRKVGHFYADVLTAGQTYNARKEQDAAEAAAEEQKRANAEIERQQMLQAGATPTEMVSGNNLALEEINKKSALRRSILSRSQSPSGKLGA